MLTKATICYIYRRMNTIALVIVKYATKNPKVCLWKLTAQGLFI